MVDVGMTACGVLAALGRPDTINDTKGATYQNAQMVHRDRRIYVYTEAGPDEGNGIVRSVQF